MITNIKEKIFSYLIKCNNCKKYSIYIEGNQCNFCKLYYCELCELHMSYFYGFLLNSYCNECSNFFIQ